MTGLSEQAAIDAGLRYDLRWNVTLLGVFPNRQGPPAPCTIERGGPSGFSGPMPALCSTSASSNGSGTWTITFSQEWKARDFPGKFAGGGTQAHSWSLQVNRRGQVTFIGERGDFPPQLAL